MEINSFLWIGGIAIAGIGAYWYLTRNTEDKSKKAFLSNKHHFSSLLEGLAKNEFDIEKWSDTIVEINDKKLITWWKSLLQNKQGNMNLIKEELLYDLQKWGVAPKVIVEKPQTDVPASAALINNLQRISPLLIGMEKGSVDKSAWSDIIVDINNPELNDIWGKIINNPDMWLRILSSWGLTYDPCSEFTYVKGREQLYNLIDGGEMTIGHIYTVVNSCWIYTEPAGSKRVVVKGNVKLKK